MHSEGQTMRERVRLHRSVADDFVREPKLYCPGCGKRTVWSLVDAHYYGCITCFESWSMNTWLDEPLDMRGVADAIK